MTANTATIIGEVCHIRAHNPGGPRYLDEQNDEERHGFDNLILMCRNHHKEIDASENLRIYTVEWLFETKRTHENVARASGEITAPADVITALSWTVAVYEAGATHMDFRNAVFKVGGEGGGPLGGGGSGGVLTITGIASLPKDIAEEMTIDLAGGHGQFPGGGGGGGGTLIFEGRPVTNDDIEDGLHLPIFFPANSVAVADGLLYVLGAGWEIYSVPEFPCTTWMDVAFTVEFGSVDPNVLLGFQFVLTDPSGADHALTTVDVAVPVPTGLINRICRSATVRLTFEAPGLHELTIRSGGAIFARYTFELRLR